LENIIRTLEKSVSLKEYKRNPRKNKQLKEKIKTVQDMKMEVEAIKKIQTGRILKIENLGKRTTS
jgi:ribosomal protein S1